MEKIELLSEERRFTFMLNDSDLKRKFMTELSIFNDGSVYRKNIIRTPSKDEKGTAYSYNSIKDALEGDIETHYLLELLKKKGLIK
jgi:hypothetical protein